MGKILQFILREPTQRLPRFWRRPVPNAATVSQFTSFINMGCWNVPSASACAALIVCKIIVRALSIQPLRLGIGHANECSPLPLRPPRNLRFRQRSICLVKRDRINALLKTRSSRSGFRYFRSIILPHRQDANCRDIVFALNICNTTSLNRRLTAVGTDFRLARGRSTEGFAVAQIYRLLCNVQVSYGR